MPVHTDDQSLVQAARRGDAIVPPPSQTSNPTLRSRRRATRSSRQISPESGHSAAVRSWIRQSRRVLPRAPALGSAVRFAVPVVNRLGDPEDAAPDGSASSPAGSCSPRGCTGSRRSPERKCYLAVELPVEIGRARLRRAGLVSATAAELDHTHRVNASLTLSPVGVALGPRELLCVDGHAGW